MININQIVGVMIDYANPYLYLIDNHPFRVADEDKYNQTELFYKLKSLYNKHNQRYLKYESEITDFVAEMFLYSDFYVYIFGTSDGGIHKNIKKSLKKYVIPEEFTRIDSYAAVKELCQYALRGYLDLYIVCENLFGSADAYIFLSEVNKLLHIDDNVSFDTINRLARDNRLYLRNPED